MLEIPRSIYEWMNYLWAQWGHFQGLLVINGVHVAAFSWVRAIWKWTHSLTVHERFLNNDFCMNNYQDRRSDQVLSDSCPYKVCPRETQWFLLYFNSNKTI